MPVSQQKPAKKSARKRPARKRHWIRNTILALGGVIVLGVLAFIGVVLLTPVPTPNELSTSQATIVYWNDGTTELGRLGDSTRRSVPLSDISDMTQKAVLAAEDRRFWRHKGIDLTAILRAARANLRAGAVVQGGSTISQQLIKNLVVGGDRTLWRKAEEALLALRLGLILRRVHLQ
jgi:membrane peptidoglycan carboxypeptidase